MLVKSGVIQPCLLYKCKLCLTISKAYLATCIAFEEDIVKEHTKQKWFRKFFSSDELDKDSLCSKDDLVSFIMGNYMLS